MLFLFSKKQVAFIAFLFGIPLIFFSIFFLFSGFNNYGALRYIADYIAVSLLFIIPINLILALYFGGLDTVHIYSILFWCQAVFYLIALLGWIFENRKIKIKGLFIPYYIFIMNLSMYLGFFRYVKGQQSVKWERAKRGS